MNQHQLMNSQPPRPPMMSGVSQPPPLQHLQQAPVQQGQLPQMMMNPVPPQQRQMMNRSYGMWPPPAGPMDRRQFNFRKPNSIPQKVQRSGGSGYVPGSKPLGPRNNWKGKKVGKGKEFVRRIDVSKSVGGNKLAISFGNKNTGIGGAYIPPSLNELQHQNRVKAKRFFNKKNFNNNNNNNNNYNRGKFAPRNTSSYLIRAKKSGGITELVSPCPVTPAILPTPIFSPSKEVLVDMAKEEWGVDGYGSMKGLIRLRSHESGEGHEGEDSDEGGSSESDVEEHVEVERRLDHDLSRFEMIYPNYGTGDAAEYNNILESRVDDQDSHIAQLEEENLILKERLFLMEREMGDMRRRLQFLERQNKGGEDVNEDVEGTDSEHDSDSHGDVHSVEVNREEVFEEVNGADGSNIMQGVENGEKKEEIIEKQFDNAEEAEFHVVEINDHVNEINSNDEKFQAVKLKEQINDIDSQNVYLNNPCPEVMQDGSLEVDWSMEDVAITSNAVTLEDQVSQVISDDKKSEKRIVSDY